ncbi:hypothetical protein MA16_Dca021023 [Dendrobium catenatum]|uniref:Uncharacterized protein n=1 Tax=Dendrobium catenatum TaxID=906689 RepID=A0A2I0X648_9ASPA|nr:hypothetical protein MA16_Dca021023 [Dendrobium catenatum]
MAAEKDLFWVPRAGDRTVAVAIFGLGRFLKGEINQREGAGQRRAQPCASGAKIEEKEGVSPGDFSCEWGVPSGRTTVCERLGGGDLRTRERGKIWVLRSSCELRRGDEGGRQSSGLGLRANLRKREANWAGG